MYVRPPNSSRAEFKLPENYSGNAFNRFSTYADMPPPTKTPINKVESSQTKDESYETGGYSPSETLLEGAHNETSQIPRGEAHEEKRGSLLSSLLPDFDLSRHFPFGHGIGSEEILILAVMLIVFVSGNERGEVDSELLLLLGLLLFAG
jgi:hypothetical protein